MPQAFLAESEERKKSPDNWIKTTYRIKIYHSELLSRKILNYSTNGKITLLSGRQAIPLHLFQSIFSDNLLRILIKTSMRQSNSGL